MREEGAVFISDNNCGTNISPSPLSSLSSHSYYAPDTLQDDQEAFTVDILSLFFIFCSHFVDMKLPGCLVSGVY